MFTHYLSQLAPPAQTPFTAQVALRALGVQVVNAFEAHRVFSMRDRIGKTSDDWKGFMAFKRASRRCSALVESVTDLIRLPLEQWLCQDSPGRRDVEEAEDAEQVTETAPRGDAVRRDIHIPRRNRFSFFCGDDGTIVRCVLGFLLPSVCGCVCKRA